MARTRNLKPGFFKNEDLADLPPLTRLAFAGLWCLADRDGRLEDRPRRIKAEILPFDDCDMDGALQQLADAGFIVRYEVNSVRYIAIPSFPNHQNPHIAEKSAGFPPPPDTSTVPAPCEHSTSTVQEPDEHGSSRALNLKPSTLTLVPSPNHGEPSEVPPADAGPSLPKPTADEVAALWNETPGFCRCMKITGERRKHISARTSEPYWVEHWREAVQKASSLPFCLGHNDRGWRADIDWFLRPDTVIKIMEGKYEGSPNGQRPGRAPVGAGQRFKDADYGQPGTF